MARGLAQYLRIFDEGSTYERWQSYYIYSTVTYDSVSWKYQSFDVEGFTAGQTVDEGGVTVRLPATQPIVNTVENAIANGLLVEVSMYEFDTLLGNDIPQEGQDLIASYVGEVVGASGTAESVTLELGSSLSPIGAQVPPRKFTSRLIGVPVKL